MQGAGPFFLFATQEKFRLIQLGSICEPPQKILGAFGNCKVSTLVRLWELHRLSRIETFSFSWEFLYVNQSPDNKILDWSKLKQIAEDILKCIWNGK